MMLQMVEPSICIITLHLLDIPTRDDPSYGALLGSSDHLHIVGKKGSGAPWGIGRRIWLDAGRTDVWPAFCSFWKQKKKKVDSTTSLTWETLMS